MNGLHIKRFILWKLDIQWITHQSYLQILESFFFSNKLQVKKNFKFLNLKFWTFFDIFEPSFSSQLDKYIYMPSKNGCDHPVIQMHCTNLWHFHWTDFVSVGFVYRKIFLSYIIKCVSTSQMTMTSFALRPSDL